ncbi:MAG: hypothetical protein Q27BB25_14240 [Blastomonas sp. CACIA14H2]|nr:MAG: hypothetical protein Q27BB25_14240 [Blastomonas sp. CACIA14H2]
MRRTEKICLAAYDPIAAIIKLAKMLIMRSQPTNIIAAMLEMLAVFKGACEDVETLDRLMTMACDREKWAGGHSLFSDIRQKTKRAEEQGDPLEIAQYAFEEVCAKTLYNLSGSNAPFDPDSPFWILPLGLALGRELGFGEPSQVSSLLKM